MVKNLLIIHIDNWSNQTQYLYDLDSELEIVSVSDLYECPEDAVIGGDLIDAGDITDFIELGIKYAKEGYSEIKCFYEELEEEPDDIDKILNKYKNEIVHN